jgi:hypothetical protein
MEPFGQDWLRTGVVSSVMANAFRKKGSSVMKPTDFMPTADREKKQKQSIPEQAHAIRRILEWAKRKGLTKKE